MANAFRSERLIYRAIDADDDEFLVDMSADHESFLNSSPFLPVPPGKKNAKESREWLEKCLLGVIMCLPLSPTSTEENDKEKSKPKPIGFLSLSSGPPNLQHHRRAGVDLCIDREYQAKGYGSEAIHWVLNWAFTMANLNRVEIGAFEWNEKAAALYHKLGFKLEGRRRHYLFYQGRYWDLIELGMLQHEWMELYGAKRKSDVVGIESSSTGEI